MTEPSIRKRIGHKDGVLALGRGRQQRHRALDQFLDPAHVLDRLAGQIRPASRACGAIAPALHGLVDRSAARLRIRGGRQIIENRAVQFIAGADLQFVKPVQHIQLGQRNPVDARGRTGLAHQNRVEPAAAPLAPGGRAELMAALAQPLAIGVVQFGRKRAFADAGRIGLHDAQHEVDGTRADPGARSRPARR